MIKTDEFLIFILPLLLILGSAVIGTVYALPPNTTDWNWGILTATANISTYTDEHSKNGYPITSNCNCELRELHNTTDRIQCNCELIDDDKEEEEEIKDEKLHEEWAKDNE